MFLLLLALLGLAPAAFAQSGQIEQEALQYFTALLRIDSSNPPGHETRVAEYLKSVCDREGIPGELLGDHPERQNFVARLKGSGAARPLLLMAHSDVVPAERSQWSVDPFGGVVKDGYIWGRGAQDTKSLLAAELAVFVALKRGGAPLQRDVIFLSESDEEAGSSGIQWMIAHAWDKIDAEFALNEGGFAELLAGGKILYNVQTTEKIPTRVKLVAQGTAGHGSMPRADNAVVHLAQAIVRLAEAEQPVRLNATTREYFHSLAGLPEYAQLAPAFAKLDKRGQAAAARREIVRQSPMLAAMLSTSVSPTMLQAGLKVNIIPTTAEAQVDVRRLPDETAAEVLERFRKIVNDPEVKVEKLAGGDQEMPATEPSSRTSVLYRAIEEVVRQDKGPDGSTPAVLPLLLLGATDGAFLRARGMGVYGVPLFPTPVDERRAHGNDERVSVESFAKGVRLLDSIVRKVAQ
ncbi:MAG TPA: M20/M25/M40 family metallo-hydrolase [Bryobacterales bacterium]|nr:M20/M25/M40 family metallo-hydrolase [Bryobacterales bacterium]